MQILIVATSDLKNGQGYPPLPTYEHGNERGHKVTVANSEEDVRQFRAQNAELEVLCVEWQALELLASLEGCKTEQAVVLIQTEEGAAALEVFYQCKAIGIGYSRDPDTLWEKIEKALTTH